MMVTHLYFWPKFFFSDDADGDHFLWFLWFLGFLWFFSKILGIVFDDFNVLTVAKLENFTRIGHDDTNDGE